MATFGGGGGRLLPGRRHRGEQVPNAQNCDSPKFQMRHAHSKGLRDRYHASFPGDIENRGALIWLSQRPWTPNVWPCPLLKTHACATQWDARARMRARPCLHACVSGLRGALFVEHQGGVWVRQAAGAESGRRSSWSAARSRRNGCAAGGARPWSGAASRPGVCWRSEV